MGLALRRLGDEDVRGAEAMVRELVAGVGQPAIGGD
jgi:hypothetical protein